MPDNLQSGATTATATPTWWRADQTIVGAPQCLKRGHLWTIRHLAHCVPQLGPQVSQCPSSVVLCPSQTFCGHSEVRRV